MSAGNLDRVPGKKPASAGKRGPRVRRKFGRGEKYWEMSSCVQNDVLPTVLAAGSDVLRVLGDCWERCRVVSHIFDPLDRCPERGGRMPPEPHTTIQVARDAFADVCSNEEVKLRVAKAMCRCPAQTEVLQRAKEIYRSLGVDLSENIRAEFREKFERHGMPTDIIELIFSHAGSCE